MIPGMGWGSLDREHPIPEILLRKMDAQAQLAQKHGLIYAPGLFFAYENQAIKDLELSALICKALGERYRDVPGIMFYLADDLLKHTPEVFNRWVKACADAFNASGRTFIVTNEFGFRQDYPAELRHGSKYLTFNAGSVFRRSVGDPVYDRLVDMRPAGKSFTYGEFVRRIPAGTPEDFYGYMIPPHLNFGMGYAMALNWKWHTSWNTIWPSDVIFPGNRVPKDHLIAFRNESFFFRQFMPEYRPPELLVVLPSAVWLKFNEAVTRYIIAFLRRLMELNADFACIDDTDLALLPQNTKALVYPIPMEMTDAIFTRLCRYVQDGGKLLVTGDISGQSGGSHLPCRPERLEQLCGVKWEGLAQAAPARGRSLFMERYLPAEVATGGCPLLPEGYAARPWVSNQLAGAEALAYSDSGKPLVSRYSWGEGAAWYTPDMNASLPISLFEAFLKDAGVTVNVISPDTPSLYCFKTHTRTGPVYTVATFPWDRAEKTVCVKTQACDVALVLKDMTLGMIHVTDTGVVDVIEAQGDVDIAGKKLLETKAHLMLSSLNGESLSTTPALLIQPITAGRVKLMNPTVNRAEIGELADGRWRPYQPLDIDVYKDSVCLEIDRLASTAWILLYDTPCKADAVHWVEKLL
jgi:hypothetical protein